MIEYDNRNQIGHDAAEEIFHKLVSAGAPASASERASYLYGMQTFCRRQLRRELASAMEELEGSRIGGDKSRLGELVSEH